MISFFSRSTPIYKLFCLTYVSLRTDTHNRSGQKKKSLLDLVTRKRFFFKIKKPFVVLKGPHTYILPYLFFHSFEWCYILPSFSLLFHILYLFVIYRTAIVSWYTSTPVYTVFYTVPYRWSLVYGTILIDLERRSYFKQQSKDDRSTFQQVLIKSLP